MTRLEFISYAIKNNPFNKQLENRPDEVKEFDKKMARSSSCWADQVTPTGARPYDRAIIERILREKSQNELHLDKIVNFFENVGPVEFERIESSSGDKLKIEIVWSGFMCQWENIGNVVQVGFVYNCTGLIDRLYIAESGEFFNNKRELVAKSEEDFFDYLTTIEYDFHPAISKRTFEMLRFFGWHEGRAIDITDFNKEMQDRGIMLTQKQLDFFMEYSDLTFSFNDFNSCWWFYSLEEVLQDNSSELRTGYKEIVSYEGRTVASKVLVCGDSPDTMFPIAIDSEGRLLRGPFPLGRNTIESINHLVDNVSPEVEWKQPSQGQKME